MRAQEFIVEYGSLYSTMYDPDATPQPPAPANKEFEWRALAQYQWLEKTITQECEPYLNAMGGYVEEVVLDNPLYRGTDIPGLTAENPYNTITVRTDRRPIDTPGETQELIDNWFQQHTGYRFRSAALFCTSRKRIALEYGEVVRIIPMGDFHYCWSENYRDMYDDLASYAHDVLGLTSGSRKVNIRTMNSTQIEDFLNKGNYHFDIGLDKALLSGHEIMVVCKQAAVVNNEWANAVTQIRWEQQQNREA